MGQSLVERWVWTILWNDFKGNTRKWGLKGEAFLTWKNPDRPFIVHANIDIKVLGTTFNVKAYQDDENVKPPSTGALVNVSKSDDNSFQPIPFYPNQKLIFACKPIARPNSKKWLPPLKKIQ